MSFDIASLSARESFWDTAGVWLSIAVAVGVGMEAVTEYDTLASWLRLDTQERFALRHRVAKAGLLLLILALAFEVVAAIESHSISEDIISGLNTEIAITQEREQKLVDETQALESKSNAQEKSLADVGARADDFDKTAVALSTKTNASLAIVKANEASLEKARNEVLESTAKVDGALAAANSKADELAGSLQTISDLQDRLRQITSDRTISTAAVAGKLKLFGNTPFVIEVSDDHESISLTSQITSALELAGWTWKENKRSDGGLEETKTFAGKPAMRLQPGLGVSVQVDMGDMAKLGDAGEALVKALRDEGLRNVGGLILGETDMKFGTKLPGVIHISVGQKN